MFLDASLRDLLKQTKNIAIVGAKDKEGQPVDMVGRYLIAAGYTVYPVHPVRSTVWGLPTYKSVLTLPQPVDIINIFRASVYCAEHAKEILQLSWKPQCFWMQSGIHSPEAGKLLATKDIRIVEDMCIKTEHQRLLGSTYE